MRSFFSHQNNPWWWRQWQAPKPWIPNPFSYDRPFYILLHYVCFSLSMEQLDRCDILTFIQFFSYIQRCFSLAAKSLAFVHFRVYIFLSFDYKLTEVKSIETSKIKPFSSGDKLYIASKLVPWTSWYSSLLQIA